jgi:uncharacterized protein (DUF1501 family)
MHNLTRRGFLGALGALSLPHWFPRMAFAEPAELLTAGSDTLVCIFLRGGADGLNVVVPHGDRSYYQNRPSIAIAEPGRGAGKAVDLDGFFGLHPAMRPLKELWDDKLLAAVQAAGSTAGNHSHFDAMDFMERGTPGERRILSGWIGRHLSSQASTNDSPFRAVGFGELVQASLRGPVPATALASIADFHLQGFEWEIEKFQTTLASLYSGTGYLDVQSHQTLSAVARLATAAPGEYVPQNGASYPDTDFGFGLKQVAQMIKADLGMEVACLDLGGWDTHEGQGGAEGYMAYLLEDLATGLHAFTADMADRMGRITVVTMTEFGRRIEENASGGTDHGTASFMFLLGGGINGGRVYGPWPGLAENQLYQGDLAVATDYRTVLAEVLERRLGSTKVAEVFPGFVSPGSLGICRPT